MTASAVNEGTRDAIAELHALIREGKRPQAIADLLDGMTHAERVSATYTLYRGLQRRLYDAVDNFLPVKLTEMVPPSRPELTPVRHHGFNTVPIPLESFSHFEKRFYRFHTNDDGITDYYDEDGRSAKKFLVRKPLTTGRITSNFGWRVHPILGYRRLHPGVDYAAPRGTPILAAGNGVVERAGPSSGYGNFTLIKHTNGYETAYGHQTAFAKGIAPGVSVRQGQIIGYVGSTGLSTGPHLHFEIRVNGQPVDPLRIRLPRGRVLEGDYLASFERERERIDTLLGNQPTGPGTKVASVASN